MNKIIWTFWDKGENQGPALVKACIKSWRLLNPEWRVVCLNSENIASIINLSEIVCSHYHYIPVQALSDIIRINLLSHYGGVWVDATCACKTPLDAWLLNLMEANFFAFFKPGPDRELSSWFLASNENSQIINIWCNFVNKVWSRKTNIEVNEFGYDQKPRINSAGDFPWLHDSYWLKPNRLPYFWFHYTFSYLLMTNCYVKRSWEAVPKISADIPHFFAKGGYSNKSLQQMNLEWNNGISPLYKMSNRHTVKESDLENPCSFVLEKLNNLN